MLCVVCPSTSTCEPGGEWELHACHKDGAVLRKSCDRMFLITVRARGSTESKRHEEVFTGRWYHELRVIHTN